MQFKAFFYDSKNEIKKKYNIFVLFCMLNREWYGYHFPELVKIVSDNHTYAKVVKIVKNRKELTNDLLEQLEETVMDSAKAQAIIDASKSSMGMDISPIDLINIQMFASRVIDMYDYRKRLHEYLHSKIGQVAPNLSSLIGDQVSLWMDGGELLI